MTSLRTGGSHRTVAIRTVDGEQLAAVEDEVVIEAPLEIRIECPSSNGTTERRSIVVLRTPGDDLELAAGLLFSEGILASHEDLAWIEPDEDTEGEVISVGLRCPSSELPAPRTTFISSSCGACGKATLASLASRRRHAIAPGAPRLEAEAVHRLPETLRAAQATFHRTGGLHAAGLFDEFGNLEVLREDVGRHNALDKVIGAALAAGGIPLSRRVVLVSGRVGFDLVQKAAMAGVAVLAAVGAPSSLAVEIARGCGMTLLGFVRNDRFNIYCDFGRILDLDSLDRVRVVDTIGCSEAGSS